MNLWEIFFIAIGLAMDAFAVSITLGLSATKIKRKEYLIPGAYFGFFQLLMPVVGYFAGFFFADKIHQADHWIAFALLAFIGGKMIVESLSKEDEKKASSYSFKFKKMLILSVATSIDALAVGISFAFLMVNIFQAVLIIGLITFLISTCGITIGKVVGAKFKSKAEFTGGLILVLIGIKILMEHLFFK